jgi:hypothetical protein
MTVLRASLLVGLTALLAGCGSGKGGGDFAANRNDDQVRTASATLPSAGPAVKLPEDAAKTPITPNERVWLGQLHNYLIEIDGAAARLYYLRGSGGNDDTIASGKFNRRLRPALATMRSCRQRMHELVGSPPSERLRAGSRYVESTCTHMRAAAAAAQKALALKDPSPLLVAGDELDRAYGQLRLADETLMPRGEGRELPRVGRASDESRIQTRYSAVAIALEGVAAEVRCWSNADWPKIVRESGDYFVEPSDPANEYGFVLASERENLAPVVCGSLDDLTYRHERPKGKGELAIAEAVVTLAHETEHVAGVYDEPAAECYGMQLMRETARL